MLKIGEGGLCDYGNGLTLDLDIHHILKEIYLLR